MAKIHLHGALASFHPEPLSLKVANPAEAFRALVANFPGIGEIIRGGEWHVVRGDPETGYYHDKDELTLGLGPNVDLHIIPAVTGAGRGGLGKVIVGVVILIAAIVTSGWAAAAYQTAMGAAGTGTAGLMGSTAFAGITYGQLAMFGAAMAMSGISQMLAPTPKVQSFEGADKNKSYMFSGPVNRMEAGNPVPVIYGRCRVGSVVVAAGVDNADIPWTSKDASGTYAMPKVSPLSGGSVVYDPSTYKPTKFTIGTYLTDAVGYKFTNISGGTLDLINSDGTTTPIANGDIISNRDIDVRYTPGDGWDSSGGSFRVQAVNAENKVIAKSRTIPIYGPPAQGGDNGAGGTDGGFGG